jgi:Tol biopolymer transport system component
VHGNASVAGIFTMNADGSDLTQLTQKRTPTKAEDHEPHWSPDGTKIAFVRMNTSASPRHESAIEVMNADGSNVRRLTPFAIDATDPRWSPNGTRILFNTHEEPAPGKSANLFTMHVDGTHLVALTHYAGGALQAFADDWSPDGTQIVYRRLVFSATDTQVGAFYIIDSHGKHNRRLTPMRVTTDAARAAWGARTG